MDLQGIQKDNTIKSNEKFHLCHLLSKQGFSQSASDPAAFVFIAKVVVTAAIVSVSVIVAAVIFVVAVAAVVIHRCHHCHLLFVAVIVEFVNSDDDGKDKTSMAMAVEMEMEMMGRWRQWW